MSRQGASTVELDDNVAVYDDVGQLLILLNSSAASVWALCDGATTTDDMVEALAAAHPDQADVIGEDVRQTLRKLAELGLVSDSSDRRIRRGRLLIRPDLSGLPELPAAGGCVED